VGVHFLTQKIEPVGWGLDENIPYKVRFLAKPSLAIIIVFPNWGATETVIAPWSGTEEALMKLTETPKKLVVYALENIDIEHADFLDGLLGDGDDEVYINERQVQLD
jgi:hypothetical protein